MSLDRDEREELERLLAGGPSLDALLRGWSELVVRIERGYDDSIYEYTNDLAVRDRLERVVEGAGPDLRAELELRLAESDGRFEAATEEGLRPLAEGPHPWWQRVPRRRVGELVDDLESLGYVSG